MLISIRSYLSVLTDNFDTWFIFFSSNLSQPSLEMVHLILWTLSWSSLRSFTTSSVQFSRLNVSDSLWPHGLQHARLPWSSLTPQLVQTDVHWVGDAIQPSHPLSSPFPPTFNLSQYQALFKWISSLHQVVKVLEFQLQHQSFQWIFRVDFLSDWLVGSPCSPRDSQESSPTTVQKHQFLGAQLSL